MNALYPARSFSNSDDDQATGRREFVKGGIVGQSPTGHPNQDPGLRPAARLGCLGSYFLG
jgi:hypothetical protein